MIPPHDATGMVTGHVGTLYTVGMGPGDPELITLKAARLLGCVDAIAFFAKRGRNGHARSIAGPHLHAAIEEIRLDYPYTTEIALRDPRYAEGITQFYDEAARRVASALDAGRDVALLCEGDPFFYGSSMYLFDRLGGAYPTRVIPGVTGMSGCWTQAGVPMLHGDDVLSVLPGTLDMETLTARLRSCDAAVIMKVGRNLPKIRMALERAALSGRAVYVERGTMEGERICALHALKQEEAPYFSIVLVPGRQGPR
ncbi:Precorrin-2 C20-methyltransferase [Granulibacter bethesdensis]|uniref:precorrin-2 C(20)-methyltransferase n=1 Tax=Granulibacter bethesdensis TaxID=364410 RepID=UPI0009099409|nr:precorrin-2 C(20)-methyltransferase [Granulibacter bethesdensis]APH56468.1 Precorrin-2 C20-methyltransferase [Granulibacter bethesdensis]